MYDATISTAGQLSLQELTCRIELRDEVRARETAQRERAVATADAELARAVAALAEHAGEVAAAGAELTAAVQALRDAGRGPAGDVVGRLQRDVATTRVQLAGGLLALAQTRLADAQRRAVAAAATLAAARGALAAAGATDPQLDAWRAQRDHLLRQVAARFERPRPAPDAVSEPQPPRLSAGEPPTKEELKALRAAIRHQERGDWKDLPAFYGTGDLPQRDCRHCGSPVPENRKRFCSRDCHQTFLQIHGTTARPRGGRLA